MIDWDVERLGAALSERFKEIAPDAVQPYCDDGYLYFGASSYPFEENYYAAGGGTAALLQVCVKALSALQDEVSDLTHEPWPGLHEQPEASGAIEGDVLYLWYGDQHTPVLKCAPIELFTR